MKKFKLLILFLGIFIIPNICNAANDIYIDSVDVLEKSDNTEIVTPASFSGLNINFDIKFVDKDDYVKYKVLVVNNSKKDYKITNTTKFKEGDYIKYDYAFTNSNVVKAKSKQTMTIKITYFNLVPTDKMNADGTYTETKNMMVSLDQGNGIMNNPKTNSTIVTLLLILTLIVCATSLIGIRRKNKVTSMLLIVGITFLALPVTILAIESIQIKINSKVTITSEKNFCVYDPGLTSSEGIERNQQSNDSYSSLMAYAYKYKAKKGMTYRDFMNSNYFNQVGHETPVNSEVFDEYDNGVSKVAKFFRTNGVSCFATAVLKDGTEQPATSAEEQIYFCDEAVYDIYCTVDDDVN